LSRRCVNHAYRFDDEEVLADKLPPPPREDIRGTERLYLVDIGAYEVLLTDTPFKRGDTNADGSLNIADAIRILGYLFSGSRLVYCLKALDANDDGGVNIADAVKVLGHLFGGEGDLPDPFAACGSDPTQDELSCDAFPPCE